MKRDLPQPPVYQFWLQIENSHSLEIWTVVSTNIGENFIFVYTFELKLQSYKFKE